MSTPNYTKALHEALFPGGNMTMTKLINELNALNNSITPPQAPIAPPAIIEPPKPAKQSRKEKRSAQQLAERISKRMEKATLKQKKKREKEAKARQNQRRVSLGEESAVSSEENDRLKRILGN